MDTLDLNSNPARWYSLTASLTTNVDDHGQDIGHSLATSCRWALHCDAGLVEATDEERD